MREICEPYVLEIDSKMDYLPGNSGGVTACLQSPRHAFKALRAECVPGINYSAFKIQSIHVGHALQWIDPTQDGVPAERLFEFDVPMAILYGPPHFVTIMLTNTSSQPQRFAVNLVGEILR